MEIAHVRVSPLGVAGPHSSKMASTALSRRPLLCRHWAPATESTSDKKTLSHPTHPPVGASTRRTSRRHSERVTGSRTHAKALSPEQRRLALTLGARHRYATKTRAEDRRSARSERSPQHGVGWRRSERMSAPARRWRSRRANAVHETPGSARRSSGTPICGTLTLRTCESFQNSLARLSR